MSSFFFSLRTIFFALCLCITIVSADTLLNTINSIPELSLFNGLIKGNKNLTTLFSNARDFTLLAPSNSAVTAWLGSSMPSSVIESRVQYHLLKRSYTSGQFSANPIFEHTYLESDDLTNVTSGQVVEMLWRNGIPIVLSANRTQSVITAKDRIATGGFIQIIDRVLSIPQTLIPSIAEFNIPSFATVLNAGGYINQQTGPTVARVFAASDLTFFAPNTKAAIDAMTAQAKTNTRAQQETLFAYHVVPSVIHSTGFKNGMKLPTLAGRNLTVSVIGSDVYVDGAKILAVDNLIANGVLHTIDSLLMPNNPTKPSRSSNGQGELSAGAKAGIAIVVIALVISIAAIFIFVRGRRKLQHENAHTLPDDSSERGLGKGGLSEQSVASEMAGHHVTGNQINHDTQHVVVQKYPFKRRDTDDIELDVRGTGERLPVYDQKKQWEYTGHAVELDGSGIKQ